MGKILVVGSSNTDLIAKVKAFPKAGETIEGLSFMQAMGGKGANQALAAHRLGGNVEFITCLGDDANGKNILEYYKNEGLNVSSSLVVSNVPSGTAMILVEESGENCIVITPGANHELSADYLMKNEKLIVEADMLVLQMEVPYKTVETACRIAYDYNTKVMLNVAPARKVDKNLLRMVDILVVNETEAETITGEKNKTNGEKAIIKKLQEMGARTVVLTLGSKGCWMQNHQEGMFVKAFKVDAIDTTAAGDTFCGALAARLNLGYDWVSSLRFASAASAICVTRMGAQPSVPTEKEVINFLETTKNDSNEQQIITTF
ncbi:MAG: ribokinase [Prolixibacteraceae bacterium]|nr:ribokinase [Prolixibacteraceae bacterium]